MACEDQISSQDLENAKTDATTLGEVATSRAGASSSGDPIITSTNRFGETTDTAQGRLNKLGVLVDDPILDWTASTLISDLRAYRYPATTGDVYIPVAPLPFTTDLTFNADNWVLYSGFSDTQLNNALINDLSQAYTFDTVADMVASTIALPVGKKISWQGYDTQSDGGSNWGIVTSGAHTDDGGSVFTLADGKYVAANLKGKSISVRKFGAVGAGDVTTPFVNAIAYALTNEQVVDIPASSDRYLITQSLQITEGTQIKGHTENPLPVSFGIDSVGSVIDFQPTVLSSLFVTSGTQHTNFRLHYSIKNLTLVGGNANANEAIDLNGAIYGEFHTLAIQDWIIGISCNATIMNSFKNVYIQNSSDASVVYEGVEETTDVWSTCTFFGAPEGIRFEKTSVAIRFVNCNFEQLDNYAMKIAKDCQSIIVNNCYAEDVPFANNASGAVFKLGYTGIALVTENQLIVTGGKYAGRNAGTVGSFLDADFCNGVIVSNVNASRFTTGFNTTANTVDNAIQLSLIRGISIASWYNDLDKVSGLLPDGAIGSGTPTSRLKSPVQYTNTIIPSSGSSLEVRAASVAVSDAGGSVYPRVDADVTLGLAGTNRYEDLYIVNAPTVGSDARIKISPESISQELLDFALSVEIKQYKLQGGTSGRNHYGIVITKEFLDGLNAIYPIDDCAAFCHSVFTDDDGEPILHKIGDVDLGDLWQIRYDEWQNIMIEALRRKAIGL